MDSEIVYLLVLVVGLPLLLLLLTGPGMWSEKWGWRVLDRIEHAWHRMVDRKEPLKPRAGRSPPPTR